MENASKALIIAGAILISILLISVAVLIMNSTGGMQDEVDHEMDAMAVRTFNDKFTTYEGSGRTASQIKTLISKVKSSNATNEVESGDDRYITLAGNATDTTKLSTNKKYTVTIEYGNGGYVSKVTINLDGSNAGTN